MPSLTPELVNRYIEKAQAVAGSRTDRLAVELAESINSPPQDIRRRNPYKETKEESKAEEEVRSWQGLILNEIHAALCGRSKKYRKHVEALRDNANLLIGGIAVHIAGQLGVAVAVVAALVAALLRLVFSMGLSVFCRRFEAGLL
jgi:hypothetical protein